MAPSGAHAAFIPIAPTRTRTRTTPLSLARGRHQRRQQRHDDNVAVVIEPSSSFLQRQQPWQRRRRRRRSADEKAPFLLLRAKKKDDDDIADADDKSSSLLDEIYNDEDFGAWVSSNLKPWPLIVPSSTSSEEEEGRPKQEDEKVDSSNLTLDTTVAEDTAEASATSGVSKSLSSLLQMTSSNNNSTNGNNNNNDENESALLFLRSPLTRILDIETLLDLTQQIQQQPKAVQEEHDDDQRLSSTTNLTADSSTTTSTSDTTWNATSLMDLVAPVVGSNLFQQGMSRVEALVTDASSAVSPDFVEVLLNSSTSILSTMTATTTSDRDGDKTGTTATAATIPSNTTGTKDDEGKDAVGGAVLDLAQKIADSTNNNVANVSDALQQVQETALFARSLLRTADGIFRKGYVRGDKIANKTQQQIRKGVWQQVPPIDNSRALFDAFGEYVCEINTITDKKHEHIVTDAEMGALAGAIYEETLPRTQTLNQSIVAQGKTEDVVWMVTDAIQQQSQTRSSSPSSSSSWSMVRTITIRGFDASDEDVDRERLLNRICTATPERLSLKKNGSNNNNNNKSSKQQQEQQQRQKEAKRTGPEIYVHSGLFDIAKSIFRDVKKYIDWTVPSHKIVLNGHSVGGSLSVLLLYLMVQEYGSEFVRRRVQKVFTFGSPPVTQFRKGLPDNETAKTKTKSSKVLSSQQQQQQQEKDILETYLNVPSTLIHGYVQPWDPIVRLFSEIDALYPLVGDLGVDGITPFANGPPRSLRPLTKAIFDSWSGWPMFRDNFKGTANQTYVSVGVQHILLPEPTRYLADRFVAVNIPVPPVETVLQVRQSHRNLYPILQMAFPLDEFAISLIPQAIRSFVHHFYPAYGFPLFDYVKELQRRSQGFPDRPSEFAFATTTTRTAPENATTMTMLPLVNGGVGGSSSSNKVEIRPVESGAGMDSYWSKVTQWLAGYTTTPAATTATKNSSREEAPSPQEVERQGQ